MSLIQEALKRQQEEVSRGRAGDGPGKTLTAPSTHPPAVPSPDGQPASEPSPEAASSAPPAVPGDKEAKAWPTLVGVMAIVVLLLGAGIWVMLLAFQQWKRPSPGAKAPEPPAAVSQPLTDLPAMPASTAIATPPASAQTRPAAPAAFSTSLPAVTGNIAAAITASSAPVTPSNILADVPLTPPPPAPKKPVRWPRLKLTGLLVRGHSGSAILNGEIVAVGEETSDGVKLISLDHQGVSLEYEGETVLLKKDGTID